jgi:hypothetical protein
MQEFKLLGPAIRRCRKQFRIPERAAWLVRKAGLTTRTGDQGFELITGLGCPHFASV